MRFRISRCLTVLLLGAVVMLSTHSDGQAFEFFDDFSKPRHCHRDPYEERIETERHDFTQSAVTVGRGVFQVESGYSFFYKETEHETESSHTLPEIFLRVGLSEDIEFRVRWNYAWKFIDQEDDRMGSEDLRYSLKLQMTRHECCGIIPTSALEIRSTAPSGGGAFTTNRAEFSLDYIYQWDFSERLTLAGSTGYGTNGFADFGLLPEHPAEQDFNVLSQSAVLGFELSELNTIYTEWYGIFSSELDDDYVVSIFNIGIDHYLSDDFVVDLRAGVGLTDDSDDFFVGIGGGYRF